MFDRIKESIREFSSGAVADEEAVESLVKDIQRDLIAADVDVELVSELSDSVREQALSEELPDGLSRKEHVLETLYSELEELLGEKPEVEISPKRILLCGLYGSGKTTTAGKLAEFYRKRGLKPGLIAADTDRPAATAQLRQVAEEVDTEFYGDEEEEDPARIVDEAVDQLDAEVLIADTAGRNSLDSDLAAELAETEAAFSPDQTYLVVPADLGQSAREQSRKFDDAVGIDGVAVTKMDTTAKGGGAVVACQHTGSPVVFIGSGEEMDDLELFDPVEYVSDMIGQPDLSSLLEKVKELESDPEEMLEGDFTLEEFLEQISSVTDAGMMEEMMEQLPIGGSQLPDNLDSVTEERVSTYRAVVDSMTREEIADPSVIDRSRAERIAEGSGTNRSDVRELIKQYRQAKNMMDKLDRGSMERGNLRQMMGKLGV